MTSKQAKLEQLLETEISSLGYEFVGCAFAQEGRKSLLRVYVDKPGGIFIEDCAKITRHVSSMLDVEDPIAGRYTLEVSSPGVERFLFKPLHYQRVIGAKIRLKLHVPRDGRRNFSGILESANDESFNLMTDNGIISLSYPEIDKANVEVEFTELKKKGGKHEHE
ncbi:MAG: ribosome maturation factor RimP [Legionellales bacterium]|nr:ribosome maturation factor RimP [Legionellales bacterium]